MTQLKHKTLKYFIIGSVVVIICLFGTLELSTRFISWVAGKGFTLSLHEYDPLDRALTSIYQWHPFTGITFKPNIVLNGSHPQQKGKARIHIDQYGFLTNGNNLEYQKLDNEIRIAFIGASTTANVSLSYDENWPGYLGNLLQNELPDKKITILNAGVPGFDTAQSIGNLALRVMPFDPDIVVIYHLYNDLKVVRKFKTFRPDYSHMHLRPFGYHQRPNIIVRWLNKSMVYVRLRNKLRELKKAQLKIEKRKKIIQQTGRLANIPDQAVRTFGQHIQSLVSIATAGGAKVVLSSFATLHDPRLDYSDKNIIHRLSALQKKEIFAIMNFTPGLTLEAVFDGFNRYNRTLRELAESNNTGWIDNASLVPHKDRYFVDRVHFSRAGAALMANNFLPKILQILKDENREKLS
jgi:lysophospholipase L1-like esterase